MEAVRDGQFEQGQDEVFNAFKMQLKRARFGLFLSPFLAFSLSVLVTFSLVKRLLCCHAGVNEAVLGKR